MDSGEYTWTVTDFQGPGVLTESKVPLYRSK